MVTRQSQQVRKRQTAAQRVQAKLAAQAAAMTAGTEAAMRAHADRQAALEAVGRADDQFREAVDALVQAGCSLEDVAELTDAPIADVRAARRPKQRDGEEPTADTPPAGSSPARRAPRARAGDRVPGTDRSRYGELDPAVTGDTNGAAPGRSENTSQPPAEMAATG